MKFGDWNKELIYKVLSIILGIIFMISLIMLVLHYTVLRKNDEKIKDVQEIADVKTDEEEEEEVPPEIRTIDFTALQAEYPDIYAWIYVPGTQVNYPILQSAEGVDTDYYLEHNLDGSVGLPGCIYTQQANAKDFSDRDTVVYGHNMRNDSMFGSLHEYEDETFLMEHPYVYIYTPEQNLVYQIFASYVSDDKLILDYYNYFIEADTFTDYLEEIRSSASAKGVLNQDLEVDGEDRILTLSTCNGSDTTRYLVIGKLLTEEEVAAIGEGTTDSVQSEAEAALQGMTGESGESDAEDLGEDAEE